MRKSTVDVREFQSRLSYCLRLVKAGHIVEITERGKPLARIIPVVWPLEKRIEAARRAGLFYWKGQKLKHRAPGGTPRDK